MNETSVVLKKLAERVLADGGSLPLALLLEHVVPVPALRDLARKLGVTPKGGFRIERAPARVLAPLLAELREPRQLDDVLALLLSPRGAPAPAEADTQPRTDQALLALRDADVARWRDEAERAREAATRARDRAAELQRRVEQVEHDAAALRAELAARPHLRGAALPDLDRADKQLQRRVHDLEAEREGFVAADRALRRQLAHNQSRLRACEEVIAELEALLPKGKRRRKPLPPPEPPSEERRFRLPRFSASFYKSLEGKDRRSVERAFQAILLFCTEGHAYPGLEVKQLGGQDTWSLRASLGLRVYFRPQADGDIELLELGDREDQNTTLRRLKER